jgi:hypothetical protein
VCCWTLVIGQTRRQQITETVFEYGYLVDRDEAIREVHITINGILMACYRSGKTSCKQVVFKGTLPKETFFLQRTQEVEKTKFE